MADNYDRFTSFAERYVIARAQTFKVGAELQNGWDCIQDAKKIYDMIGEAGRQRQTEPDPSSNTQQYTGSRGLQGPGGPGGPFGMPGPGPILPPPPMARNLQAAAELYLKQGQPVPPSLVGAIRQIFTTGGKKHGTP